MREFVAEACGKIILCGEHFVVHGAEAVALPSSYRCRVVLSPSQNLLIKSKWPIKQSLTERAVRAICDILALSPRFNIKIDGSLPTFGGLGSSAAFCVALTKALVAYKGEDFSKQQVNEVAFEGEKVFHGTPSGIDNTVATFEKPVIFKRGAPLRFLECEPPPLTVVWTGIYSPTSVMVKKVSEFRERNPHQFSHLLSRYELLKERMLTALMEGNMAELGNAMYENHLLLKQLGVSSQANDRIVDFAKHYGCAGAKLTGGGGGGCCIVLCATEQFKERVKKEFVLLG